MAEDQETHLREEGVKSLKLKIKLLKPEEEGLNRTIQEEENVSSLKLKMAEEKALKTKIPVGDLRVCNECGKQFTSGKALGGHKRACLQSKIKINKSDLNNKNHHPQQNKHYTCYVCGQYFMSLNSLHGHMRKHPDREWRGTQPPNEPVNLLESLKGWSWPVKVKRSQRLDTSYTTYNAARQGRDHHPVIDNDPSMEEAANDLLLLALSRPPSQSQSQSRGLLLINGKRKLSDTYDDESTDHSHQNELMKKKNTRLMTRSEDDDEMRQLQLNLGLGLHYCPICNKGFEKHQALGGHVASHSKNKNHQHVMIKKELPFSFTNDDQEITAGASSTVVDAEHQCNICSKSFNSGMALGGHKRCHWNCFVVADHHPVISFSNSSQLTTFASQVTDQMTTPQQQQL